MDKRADNIYLNISIKNESNSNTSPGVFSATYDQPILSKPSDYYATIVKFEIPLQTLPLLVLPIVSSETKKAFSSSVVGTAASNPAGSGSDIIGTGTAFTSDMVGGTIVFASGNQLPITEYVSPTLLRSNLSATNPNQAYAIYSGELAEGFATQVGNTVTLSSETLYSTMANGVIVYSTGDVRTITAVKNSRIMTVGGAPLAVSTSAKIYYSYNPNLTSLVIGVCENNQPGSKAGVAPYTPIQAFTENVIFEPANQFIGTNDIRYPYVFSYEILMQMLSKAMLKAWVAAGSPGSPANEQPYISFDPAIEFANLMMPQGFVDAGANGWTVCFNNRIQNIFPSYPIYISSDPSFENGRYEINTNQFAGLGTTGPGYNRFFYAPETIYPSPNKLFIVEQNFKTVDYINSVRKIVIVSNTMPIRKEYFPPPNSNNSGLSNTIPVLADFQINLDNIAGAQRSVALYESDLYRLIDLISDTPMSRIDIQLFWADQENNLYPLFLTQNDSATIKLGFFSKEMCCNK